MRHSSEPAPAVDGPPMSVAHRALALACGPLAVVATIATWLGALGLVAGTASDSAPADTCHGLGFGCELSDREVVELFGSQATVPVIMVAVLVGVLATRFPARHRVGGVAVFLAGQVVLAALIGVTAARVLADVSSVT